MVSESKFAYGEDDNLEVVKGLSDPALPNEPRSLGDRESIVQRRRLLTRPHVTPLMHFVDELRAESRGHVPDFDPLDGGVRARMLFLMEKPGPMTNPHQTRKRGSGFISRDNNDQTAAAIFNFMISARISRDDTVLWNTIPWWNGTIKVVGQEWRDGLARLDRLLDLLPELSSVMLVGKKAARAKEFLRERPLTIFVSPHPSPVVRASRPQSWQSIPEIWAEAYRTLR